MCYLQDMRSCRLCDAWNSMSSWIIEAWESCSLSLKIDLGWRQQRIEVLIVEEEIYQRVNVPRNKKVISTPYSHDKFS